MIKFVTQEKHLNSVLEGLLEKVKLGPGKQIREELN